MSNISFSKEILSDLCIDYIINKPATDKEYYEKNRYVLNGAIIKTGIKKPKEKLTTKEFYIAKNLKNKTRNTTEMLWDKSMNSKYSKGALQRINHGH